MGLNLRDDVVYPFLDLIDGAVVVLGGIALLLFLISVVRYIAKGDEAHSKSEERKAMGWGLLALFVLFSIWGILNIFEEMIPYTDQGKNDQNNMKLVP